MKNESSESLNPVLYPFNDHYAQADLYVRMAHKATARSFWAYSAMIVIAVITIIALFNSYFSYDIGFFRKANIDLREDINIGFLSDSTLQKKLNSMKQNGAITLSVKEIRELKNAEIVDTLITEGQLSLDTIFTYDTFVRTFTKRVEDFSCREENIISKELRNNMIRNYIDSQYINIPLIGVKISSNDILILMAIAFFIISFWLLICSRSENFTIGKILSLTQNKSINVKRYIFYGICFNNMLFPTTKRHGPYRSLSEINRPLLKEIRMIREKEGQHRTFHKIVTLLIGWSVFIPSFFLLICLALDIMDSMHWMPYFSPSICGLELEDYKLLRFDFNKNNNSLSQGYVDSNIWGTIIVASVLWITIVISNYWSRLYLKGTDENLRQFKSRYKHDDDCAESINHNNLANKHTKIATVAIKEELLKKKKGRRCAHQFGREYCESNGYYLLTYTSNVCELKRLWRLLERGSTILPEGFIPAIANNNILKFDTQERVHATVQELKGYEMFIFLVQTHE